LFGRREFDATVLAFREERQMPNHLLVVMANSAPDLDDEFNRWYDEEHLAWVLDALPGVVGGRRFVRADLAGAPDHPYRYLILYEIAEDRLDEAYERWEANRQRRLAHDDADLPPISLAMDAAGSIVGFFSPVGTVVGSP
jgi:hypothetical protein